MVEGSRLWGDFGTAYKLPSIFLDHVIRERRFPIKGYIRD